MLRVSLLLCIVPTFGIIVRDPPPTPRDYKYSYDVQDFKTGDNKSQHEVRLGDIVIGAYTVVGPDGTKRTVEYTADDKHGFNAVISEESVTPSTTQPTYVQQPIVTSYDLNALRYPTPRPIYSPLVHLNPKTNNEDENPIVYFIPQNIMEARRSFGGGNFFVPAKK